MVRFIQYWIERSMENPEEREEKARKHIEMVTENAKALKRRWAEPVKLPGYWQYRETTSSTMERLSQAEADVISPYKRILKDMDNSKKAKEDAGK